MNQTGMWSRGHRPSSPLTQSRSTPQLLDGSRATWRRGWKHNSNSPISAAHDGSYWNDSWAAPGKVFDLMPPATILPSHAAQYASCLYSVWPPPPLPPVSRDVEARVEALEAQKMEKLHIELQRCNAQWEQKFEELKNQSWQEIMKLRQELQTVRRGDSVMGIELQAAAEATRMSTAGLKDERDRLREECEQLRVQREQLQSDVDHLGIAKAEREKAQAIFRRADVRDEPGDIQTSQAIFARRYSASSSRSSTGTQNFVDLREPDSDDGKDMNPGLTVDISDGDVHVMSTQSRRSTQSLIGYPVGQGAPLIESIRPGRLADSSWIRS